MPTQNLTTEIPQAVVALSCLIDAHSRLTRELSARLVEQHAVTLNEYEVLLLLSRAPERMMKRVDLASEVRLSPSGVTRMLDRLENAGLVDKGSCETDARITYAVLTDVGIAKLAECSSDHFAAVEELLGARLDNKELASLVDLLGRLDAGAGEECEPPAR